MRISARDACLLRHKVDGAILTNTTLSREGVPPTRIAVKPAGFRARPLFARSTRFLAKCYLATEGKLPLIGVGGIDSAESARQNPRRRLADPALYRPRLWRARASVRHQRCTCGGDRSNWKAACIACGHGSR